jgi:hypothetical protein
MSMLSVRTGQLLNLSGLARDLGIGRDTTEKYLTILERLFLVRRLPAWHRNRAKRLIKAPKIHVVDSGLCSTLIEIGPGDWNSHGHEVKKSASINPKDGVGIARLAAQAGNAYKGGMVLYCGTNTLSLDAGNGFAVPMDALWS